MLIKQLEKPFAEYSHLSRIFLAPKYIYKVKKKKKEKKKRKKRKKKCHPWKYPYNHHMEINKPERCQHIPHIILVGKYLFQVKHNYNKRKFRHCCCVFTLTVDKFFAWIF